MQCSVADFQNCSALSPISRRKVTEAVRLVHALLEIIPANELSTWLHTPNSGFDGRTPWTLIQKGERDVVWEMIHKTRHGAYS